MVEACLNTWNFPFLWKVVGNEENVLTFDTLSLYILRFGWYECVGTYIFMHVCLHACVCVNGEEEP